MRGTVDGLILREVALGESDKLLTVLTAEHGRILISAKGVRSMKSKHLSLCRVFTYGNFEYYERGGKRWLAGGSVNDAFFGLNSDVESFALASYVAEIAAEITGEGIDASEILRVTLNTLYAIEKKLKPLQLIKGAYELFAAFRSGYEPELSGCIECGAPSADVFYLDVMGGSLLCQSCMSKRGSGHVPMPETDAYLAKNIFLPMSPPVTAAARYIAGAAPSRLFAFELKDRTDEADLSRLGETYLQNHLERGFETLNFLKMVL
ncbi:MAG: DNA repair protein RecO [Clostridia bacterium]|nr:DNA repair protein RecO [Clostridia bacterium]